MIPRADIVHALSDAAPRPFWLDIPERPSPLPQLEGLATADLAIVGGGFTGLWTAVLAKERDPDRDVALVEGKSIAFGATGRNGGFLAASLTHGIENGAARFPDEIEAIERLGMENFVGIRDTILRYKIDAEFEESGEAELARRPHELTGLKRAADLARAFGHDVEILDRDGVHDRLLRSPVYLGGLLHHTGQALVHPAKLAWGLRRVALDLGVRIFEGTPVGDLRGTGASVDLVAKQGTLRAGRVILATNAFPPLIRRIRRYVAPVYDYVLVSEPLSPEQRTAIGWEGRQGLADASNRFHYFRLTADDRILWGGYDAIYHWRGRVRPEFDQRDATHGLLAGNFFETFPQLEGIWFTHRFGGVIDTCSRFSVMFGTAFRGRLAFAVGYTGLGVGAARFGAATALDLVDGLDTERTRLRMVRRPAMPFPPEPVRYLGIRVTKRAMTKADRTGREGPWLRMLDALGLGFQS